MNASGISGHCSAVASPPKLADLRRLAGICANELGMTAEALILAGRDWQLSWAVQLAMAMAAEFLPGVPRRTVADYFHRSQNEAHWSRAQVNILAKSDARACAQVTALRARLRTAFDWGKSL